MQQRKKIYERALNLLEMQREKYTCSAIYMSSECVDFFVNIIENCKEFMLFKPDDLSIKSAWFDNQLEREICLDFCILFCNDKMFEDA
jgi:hypothetical protein